MTTEPRPPFMQGDIDHIMSDANAAAHCYAGTSLVAFWRALLGDVDRQLARAEAKLKAEEEKR